MILSYVTLILLYLGILQQGLQVSTYFSVVSLFNVSILFRRAKDTFTREKRNMDRSSGLTWVSRESTSVTEQGSKSFLTWIRLVNQRSLSVVKII